MNARQLTVEKNKSFLRFDRAFKVLDKLMEEDSSQMYIDQVSVAKKELRMAFAILMAHYDDSLEEVDK